MKTHQRSSAFCQGTYKRCWRSSREAWRWWALCRAVCRCCPSIAAVGGRRSPGPRQRPCESTSLSLLLLAGRLARRQWSDMKGTSMMSSNSTTGLDLMRPVWSHIWNDNVKEDHVNLKNDFTFPTHFNSCPGFTDLEHSYTWRGICRATRGTMWGSKTSVYSPYNLKMSAHCSRSDLRHVAAASAENVAAKEVANEKRTKGLLHPPPPQVTWCVNLLQQQSCIVRLVLLIWALPQIHWVNTWTMNWYVRISEVWSATCQKYWLRFLFL